MTPKPYLAVMGASAMLLLVASVALAVAMDPYGIFRVDGRERPTLEADIGQMKLFQAVRRGARAVILGNSRADIGFDPRHPLLGNSISRAHNIAAPGAGIEVSLAQLSALCEAGRVDTAVLGVDFIDFIRPNDQAQETLRLRKMRTVPSLGQYARALVSAEVLLDSLRALLAPDFERINRQTASGMNLLNAYAVEARAAGYAPFFEQRLNENAKNWAQHSWKLMGPQDSSPTALRKLLSTAQECRTRVVVVTYPYHIQYLALVREAGLWGAFEDWKRLITNLISDAGMGNTVLFIDVSRASPVSRERIPERGEVATTPQWYWESGHFKSALGDLVLSSTIGEEVALQMVAAVRLTPENLEAVLQSDRAALDRALAELPRVGESASSAWRDQSQKMRKQ